MEIPFDTRLNCKYSYAKEEDPRLFCEIGDIVCDGTVYQGCLDEMTFAEQLEVLEGRKD